MADERQVDVLVGRVEQMFSEPREAKCVCCTDRPEGRHCFGTHIHIADGVVSKYSHLNDVMGFVNDFAYRPGMNGRHIRITIEALDASSAAPASEDQHG